MVQAVPSHTVDPWQLEEKLGGVAFARFEKLFIPAILGSLATGFETT